MKAERCFMGSGPIAFMIGKGISEQAVVMSDCRRVAREVRAGMEKGTPLAVISTQFQMVEEKWEMQKEESLSPRRGLRRISEAVWDTAVTALCVSMPL